MILMVTKHKRPVPTPAEAMNDLLKQEMNASLNKEFEDASMWVEAMGVVDMKEAVEPETATKVIATIAKLTAILQMHAESRNALRREETTMSALVSSAGSHDTSKLIESLSNVYMSSGQWRKPLPQQPSLQPETAILPDLPPLLSPPLQLQRG